MLFLHSDCHFSQANTELEFCKGCGQGGVEERSASHTLSKHFQTKSTFTKQHFGIQIKSPSAMSSIRIAFCPVFPTDTLIIYIKQCTLRDEISVSPIHSLPNRRDICILGKVWFAKSGPCAKQIRTLKHRRAKAHSFFPH